MIDCLPRLLLVTADDVKQQGQPLQRQKRASRCAIEPRWRTGAEFRSVQVTGIDWKQQQQGVFLASQLTRTTPPRHHLLNT